MTLCSALGANFQQSFHYPRIHFEILMKMKLGVEKIKVVIA